MHEVNLDELDRQLQDCISGGYGNARYPIDWFKVGPPLLAVARAVKKYRLCKGEQSARSAHDPHLDMICYHVIYNGGTQSHSCVAELFAALDALEVKP